MAIPAANAHRNMPEIEPWRCTYALSISALFLGSLFMATGSTAPSSSDKAVNFTFGAVFLLVGMGAACCTCKLGAQKTDRLAVTRFIPTPPTEKVGYQQADGL